MKEVFTFSSGRIDGASLIHVDELPLGYVLVKVVIELPNHPLDFFPAHP